jgi:methylenetetrahydrofolate--tRNA-(uracil-5-)-methyltransferase
MYNLVGFQTRLKQGEQGRVFRTIPGLEKVTFLRFGSIHRNTFLDSPKVLLPTLQARVSCDLFVAGQLAGVEGYVESIGAGLVAGINAARLAKEEQPMDLPREMMLGSLLYYITAPASDSSLECGSAAPALALSPGKAAASLSHSKDFQPMNANFGLLPPLDKHLRGRDKRRAMAERALAATREFRLTLDIASA